MPRSLPDCSVSVARSAASYFLPLRPDGRTPASLQRRTTAGDPTPRADVLTPVSTFAFRVMLPMSRRADP